MSRVCPNSWLTNPCESIFEYSWRSSDLIQRSILVFLALMLVYTLFAVVRSCRIYARFGKLSDFEQEFSTEFPRKNFVAEFKPAIGALRGIASAAPYLGLAGTSYGILAALSYGYVGSRGQFEGYISARLASTRTTCVLGIPVAVAAILAHNLLHVLIKRHAARADSQRNSAENDLGSFQCAQRLSLRRRFSSPPPFALLAAPTLAYVIALFMPFHPYRIPTGLRVALPPIRCNFGPGDPIPNRIILLRITNSGKPLINMEPLDWGDLRHRLGEIYRLREERTLYIYAENEVPFQSVADAIDIALNSPAPGSDSLDVKVALLTSISSRECVPIPVRIIP